MTFRSRFDTEIFALALPALGSLIADPLVSLVDTAFVGRLGALPLAALGVNTALFGLIFFAFNFLAYGTTPLIAKAFGAKDLKKAGRYASHALFLALVLGVAALVFIQLFAPLLLKAMGASSELMQPALNYLRIRALAGPALLIITASNGIFRGFQDMRTPLVITLGLNLINLVLDALFILVFHWGLSGAALASFMAQALGAAAFLYLLAKPKKALFAITWQRPSLSELKPFLRIGWEMLLRTSSLLLTLTLATAIATRLGALQVAAHQVMMQVWLLLALTLDALAIPAQALVGRYLGEGRAQDAKALANRLLFLGLGLGLLLSIFFALTGRYMPRLFTNDAEVIAICLIVLPFVIFTQPLNALVFVWDGIFIGLEDFAYLAKAMMLSAFAAMIVLLLVQPLAWGFRGVWWGLVVFMFARMLTLALRYRRHPAFTLK